jgi:hypothetical protein
LDFTNGHPFIQFGHVNRDMTKDGKLYKLPNIDDSKWAFVVDNFYFGKQNVGYRLAYIDSSNSTIQLPADMFGRLYDQISASLDLENN